MEKSWRWLPVVGLLLVVAIAAGIFEKKPLPPEDREFDNCTREVNANMFDAVRRCEQILKRARRK